MGHVQYVPVTGFSSVGIPVAVIGILLDQTRN